MEDPIMAMKNEYEYSLRHATKEMMDRTTTRKTYSIECRNRMGTQISDSSIPTFDEAFDIYENYLKNGCTDIVMYEHFYQIAIVKYEWEDYV